MTLSTKLTILEERFLTSYFEFELLIADFISKEERSKLFCELSRIYLIDDKRRSELFDLCQSDGVISVSSESDYNLQKRLNDFKRLNGITRNRDEAYFIDIKGRAITLLKQMGYNSILDATKPATFSFLANTCQFGVIGSMRILGTLQILGIFTDKDERSGKALIKKCARWNDADSILTMLMYEEQNRKEYISMLYSVSDSTPFEVLFDNARVFYGFDRVRKHKPTDLIESAIGLGIVKRDIYSPQVVRIAYSEVLSDGDKTKLILNNQNLIAQINDLPLSLNNEELELCDNTISMLQRENERQAVIQSVMYSAMRGALCPCLVTNDEFVSNDYITMLDSAFENVNVIKIDARELNGNDFSLDKNNVLIRSLCEDKRNIILLVLRSGADINMVELLARFLKESTRASFHLASPGISLDLSSVLTVCVCDSGMLSYIKQACDIIQLSPISSDEASRIIDKIIAQRSLEYGIENLAIEDSAKRALIEKFGSFNDTSRALDKIIYSYKGKSSEGLITLDSIERFIDSRSRKLGF